MVGKHALACFRVDFVDIPQWREVTAGMNPETAILKRCVFDSDPKTDEGSCSGVEVAGVPGAHLTSPPILGCL